MEETREQLAALEKRISDFDPAPTATAEMEETRAQLAALEKRITDIDPAKMMTSRLHFRIVAFQNISDA